MRARGDVGLGLSARLLLAVLQNSRVNDVGELKRRALSGIARNDNREARQLPDPRGRH